MPFKKLRRRYRRARAKVTNKRIAKIAKSVVMRNMETKQLCNSFQEQWYYGNTNSGSDSTWYSVAYPLQNGTADTNMTGNTILLKSLRLKIQANYNVTKATQPAYFRVALVATDFQVPWGLRPTLSLNYGYQYGQSGMNNILKDFNPAQVTVLKSKTFSIPAANFTTQGTPIKILTINKVFKKGFKMEFIEQLQTANTDKYAKRKNLYWVVDYYQPESATSVSVSGDIFVNQTIKFKDV